MDEPLRRQVTLAYLLFRVADTLEDAASWSATQRSVALGECAKLVRAGTREEIARASARWIRLAPTGHDGYLDLLRAFPDLLEDARVVDAAAAERITYHLLRTIERMDAFVRRANDNDEVVLHTERDLREYCYAVAGIVGELLTDLFILDAPQLEAVSLELHRDAAAFGEGLQLVNIVRDAMDDAKEGRAFLPSAMRLDDVFALAFEDLDRASAYVDALRRGGAPSGTVGFVALPVELARATLSRVRRDGAGAKLTRGEVAELMASVQRA